MNLFGPSGPRRPGSDPAPRSDRPWADAPATTLSQQPVGSTAVLGEPSLSTSTVKRLRELGLRAGAEVTVLHRTAGRGRVIAAGDTRIALDRATLEAWPVVVGHPRRGGRAVSPAARVEP